MESTTVLKVVILACLVCACTGQRKIIKNIQFGAEVKQEPDFSCPEEFGYYPHPTDCTQYYVCVFGGALLESCTGGLKYSHELQTCDWPRNVGCDAGASESQGPVRTVPQSIRISSVQKPQVQAQPQSQQRQRVEAPSSRYQPQLVQRNPQHHVQSAPQLSQQDYQLIKERERQQQLYAESDEETLPAEEVESERQQRVYRGQPSTVGQVQRDRDGVAIRHSNAISNTNDQEEKIRAVSYRTSQLSQEAIPLKQYRVDPSLSSDRYISAPPASVTSMANTGPVVFNNSRSIDNNQYDNHYWDVYDDDVDLYRDVDYGQNYSPNSQETLQDNRPTPAPVMQNHHQQAYSPTPNNIYNSDINVYHNVATQDYSEEEVDQYQSARQPIRGNKNDLSYDAVPSIVPVSSTSRTTTSTTTTTTTTNRPSTSAYVRGNIRNRGQAVHRTQSIDNTVTVNRGTPPTRVRSTLKPSTSIISKASEFVDIYKYPPRRPAPIYPTPIPDKTAAKCRKDVCLLPDCSCGGKEIPGGLPVEQVPQLVLLTFDDSVNDLNKGLYQDLFERGRVNPNGCPLAATFYVSHEWTDYSQVQNLYSTGHEIASHTVSHSFGEQFSQKKWNREVSGQREILSAYGGVRLEDIRGMRAPFLSVGGNKMFKMLYDSNFTYDSSMPVYENKPPSWPYTLDYKLFHDCMIPPCPTRSYPGVWEVPMVMWQDLKEGRCSMADACSNPPASDGVVKMLMKNFDRHYTSNRAPFGLYYHAAWFTQPHHKEGFIKFLDTINSLPDVYLVTNWQALQWVRDPTPLSRLHNFQPFQCDYPERPKKCNNPKVCNLWHKSGVRYMRTCQPCPDIYPWTGKTGIKSSRIDNDIEK